MTSFYHYYASTGITIAIVGGRMFHLGCVEPQYRLKPAMVLSSLPSLDRRCGKCSKTLYKWVNQKRKVR